MSVFLVIWILEIRICFGFLLRSPTLRVSSQFRYSDFGFIRDYVAIYLNLFTLTNFYPPW